MDKVRKEGREGQDRVVRRPPERMTCEPGLYGSEGINQEPLWGKTVSARWTTRAEARRCGLAWRARRTARRPVGFEWVGEEAARAPAPSTQGFHPEEDGEPSFERHGLIPH